MKKPKDSEYKGYRSAGIRLKEEILSDIDTGSSRNEPHHIYACHMFDKAHIVMLAEENLIPLKHAAQMLECFRKIKSEELLDTLIGVGGGIHSGEQYLVRKLSHEIGGKIHLGRSSGDLDKVALKITIRNKILTIIDALNSFRKILLTVAKQNVDTIMPGYTHGQPAQPLTFGHQLLYWATALSRDFDRLKSVFHRVNSSPAGAGILTGSNFSLNRNRTSDLLGFDNPCENTIDAVHCPDDILETFSVIGILHTNLSRWADDIIFLSTPEIGMLDIPDRLCSISSMLPQKKNPVALEHIRGSAANTLGGLITAFHGESGQTGLGIYSRYHYSKPSIDRALNYVARDIKWMAAIISDIKVNKDLMKKKAGAFWATASDLASALVKYKDLPWRTAHQIVCIFVRLSLEKGISRSEVDSALLDEAAIEYTGNAIGLEENILKKFLDPVETVKLKNLYGGPAADECLRSIKRMMETLNMDVSYAMNIRNKIIGASYNLEKAIDNIITQAALK